MLALVAHQNEFSKDAATLLEAVLEASPGYRAARHDYVLALIALHRHKQAREQIEILIAAEPDHPTHRMTLASILVGEGSTEAAIALYGELVRQQPGNPELHLSLGHALKTQGRRDEAERAYREAARQRVNFGDAYWSLANLKTYRFADEQLATMREQVDARRTPFVDRYHLCFALGKALEDRGEYAESFQFYARGNALKKAECNYRPEVLERTVEKQIELCTREFFEQRQGYGCDDPVTHLHRRPAPRRLDAAGADSRLALAGRRHHGTGRHSAAGQRARPACERRALPGRPGAALGGRLPRLRRGLHPRHATLPGRQPAVLHRQDAEQLPPRQPDPPDAAEREDHRRAPRTDGLLLQQLQAAVSPPASSSPTASTTSRAITALYVRLMDHWDSVLPGRVLRVQHEDVIDDLEGSVRRILDYCGLEFEPACVEFHKNERRVHTASSEQVRRPINREGVDQWKNFEPWLGPLREALGPLAAT